MAVYLTNTVGLKAGIVGTLIGMNVEQANAGLRAASEVH